MKTNTPTRQQWEFKTYKTIFKKLRPLFYLLTKLGRVPESFYLKFCFPDGSGTTAQDANRK